MLFICGLAALFLQSLHHAYFRLSYRELRRLASRGKPVFKRLYSVAKYDTTAHIFFSFLKFVFAAATVIITCRTFDPLMALILLSVFSILWKAAASKDIGFITRQAGSLAPSIAKLLHFIEPLTHLQKSFPLKRRYRLTTDVYEKEDLKEILERQKRAVNNRIEAGDLENALNALEFGSKKIKDHMVPRKNIRFITTKEPIGPILLTELHKSGFSCFPVQGNSENEVVGMLDIESLSAHTEGGIVADAMDPLVFYVQEDKGLEEVLKAFSKTGRHIFMTVNSREKLTGLITVEDVLEQIVGHPLRNDFENYADPKSVAQS